MSLFGWLCTGLVVLWIAEVVALCVGLAWMDGRLEADIKRKELR